MKTMDVKRIANTIARRAGYGLGDIIVVGDKNCVVSHVRYGYRKYTTGEYVSNKYRANFGWKNTFYQPAITTVMLRDPRAGWAGVAGNFVSAS